MCPKGIRLFVRLKKLKQGYRNPTCFRRWVKVAGSGGVCYTCVMGTWKSKNRHKYLLQYQIIFVCKYRKKLLMSKQISDDIKQFSYEICQKHKVIIRYMETDKEHTFWTDGYFVCSVGNNSLRNMQDIRNSRANTITINHTQQTSQMEILRQILRRGR